MSKLSVIPPPTGYCCSWSCQLYSNPSQSTTSYLGVLPRKAKELLQLVVFVCNIKRIVVLEMWDVKDIFISQRIYPNI